MFLSTKRKHLIRKYTPKLLYSNDLTKKESLRCFFWLIKPSLKWICPILKDKFNLEDDEIESELYLLTSTILFSYNKERSSIVPYLEKAIPWKTTHLIYSLKKKYKQQNTIIDHDTKEFLDTEFYLTSPNVLFEDRYLGKVFTNAEKYLIYIIIISDSKELSKTALAKQLNLERKTVAYKLKELGKKLKLEEFYYGNTKRH